MPSNYLGEKLISGGEISEDDYRDFLVKIGNMFLAGEPNVTYLEGKTRKGEVSFSAASAARRRSIESDIGQILIEEFRNAVEAEAAVFDRIDVEEKPTGASVIEHMFAGAGGKAMSNLSASDRILFADPTVTKLEYAEQFGVNGEKYIANVKALNAAIRKERSVSGGKTSAEWRSWLGSKSDELNLEIEIPSGDNVLKSVEDRLKKDVASVEKGLESQAQVLADFEASEDVRVAEDLYSSVMGANTFRDLADSGLSEETKAKIVALPEKDVVGSAQSSDPLERAAFNQQQVQTLVQRDLAEDAEPRREPEPGELDADPATLPPGTDLTASEREREFGVSEQPAVPEMEAAAIEAQQAADLREAEIETEKTLAEDFAAAEFGVGGPARTSIGGVDPNDEQDPALDLSSRLGDIGSAFNISDQFGYRYFLFDPGTENERQDMLIDDPDNPGTQINVLEYITSKNLTNEAEILEAFKQTEWFNETSETMQNFDLAWDAAGPWDNWDNLTARREELIGDEKDYIEDQLELLGITDEVDEAEINKLATFVKRNGMDTSEIRDYLSDVESIDFQSYIADADEGLLGTYKSSLATTAASYMVELDDDQLNMFVEGLYDADDPAAQLSLFKNQFKNMAKERFPTLSGVIDQGITPQQYFAPYSARVSKLLDRPVDFMGERDSGIFDKIASGMPDEKFGQRTMTFTEMNEYVRGLDEWQYTKNANDEARQIANNVGRMFGFVA